MHCLIGLLAFMYLYYPKLKCNCEIKKMDTVVQIEHSIRKPEYMSFAFLVYNYGSGNHLLLKFQFSVKYYYQYKKKLK